MQVQRGQNLTYGLVEALGQAIVTGEYGAGRPFPNEAELAAKFGASRTITREAVKMLTAKGLLSARPRQGTMIEPEANWNLFDPDVLRWHLDRKFSLQLLLNFTEIRLAIEPTAARLSARKGDPAAISEMAKAIGRMKAAQAGQDDGLAADTAFHTAVMNGTGNPFYIQMSGVIGVALRISIRFTNALAGHMPDVDAHEAVLDAIRAGKPEKAAVRMTDIVVGVMELIHKAMPA